MAAKIVVDTRYEGSWAHQMKTGALALPPLDEDQKKRLLAGDLTPGGPVIATLTLEEYRRRALR